MEFIKSLWLTAISLSIYSLAFANEMSEIESEVLEVVEFSFKRLETELMSKLYETVQRELDHRILPLKEEISQVVNDVTKLGYDLHEIAREGVMVENRLTEIEKAISG